MIEGILLLIIVGWIAGLPRLRAFTPGEVLNVTQWLAANLSLHRGGAAARETHGQLPGACIRTPEDLSRSGAGSVRTAALSHDGRKARTGDALDRVRGRHAGLQRSDDGADICCRAAQHWLPLNPQHLPGVEPVLALNTAISFTTNTNWQSYVPESTMSYLTQMLGLATHNFWSAAVGMALAIAFVRGIARREMKTLGNFWVDLTRGTLWVLLPISIVFSLALVSQGVVQNFRAYDTAKLVEPQKVTGQ